jgi:hypothetical protein
MFLLLNNPVLRKLRQRWISGVVERTLYYCGQRVGDNLRIPYTLSSPRRYLSDLQVGDG